MDTNDLNKLKSQNQLHFFHQLALQYFILYLVYPEFTAGIITIPFEMYENASMRKQGFKLVLRVTWNVNTS